MTKGVVVPLAGFGLLGAMAAAMFFVPQTNSQHLAASLQADEHLQRACRDLLEYDPQFNFEAELRDVLGPEAFENTEDPAADQRYSKALSANTSYLQDALREVDQALRVSVGQVNMRQDASANRLRGIIRFQQGLATSQRLSILRAQQEDSRASLRRRLRVLDALKLEADLVEKSGIEVHVTQAGDQLRDLERELTTQQGLVSQIQARVDRLTDDLEAARGQADAARAEMERLSDAGVDLADPNGMAGFARAYREAADRYRFLIMQAQVLEFGTLENATIDLSGDMVTGAFEPIIAAEGIGYTRGLVHYQQDLDIGRTTLQNLQQAVELGRGNMRELAAMNQAYEERAVRARSTMAAEVAAFEGAGGSKEGGDDTGDDADTALLEDFLAESQDIRALEDEAIAEFEDAAKSYQTAVAGVATEMREASAAAPQDSTRAQLHYTSMAKDQRSVQGHIRAHQAEAMLRHALVLVGRGQDEEADAELFAALGDYFNEAQRVEDGVRSAAEQRQAGIALVNEAIALLDTAKNDMGAGNWVVAAEIGSAHYMLGLLGDETGPDRALAWYAMALENVEDQAFAAEHVRMREYIRRRSTQK